MRTILLTRGMEALCDGWNYDWLNQWLWRAHPSSNAYYAATQTYNENGVRIYIFMHNIIGKKMGLIGTIDHIDRNSLNNREENLRGGTSSQSGANRGKPTNNTSGYKGVTWQKREQKWKAHITFQKHHTSLGCFDCPIEAAEAYDRAARKLFKEFAVLNFPREGEQGVDS